MWLKKNAMNAGGQRTEGSIIKQDNQQDLFMYTKEDICNICNVSVSSFEHFAPQELTERDFIAVGSNHRKLYNEEALKQFQMWLKKNAMNAGGQRTEGSIIKQDNQQDLFIGCVATKGTPDEIRSLAKFLNGVAEQKEQLEIATNVNHQLQLENKKLANENDYLKKVNEINTAQIGYYTKKYHSWQDDYENY